MLHWLWIVTHPVATQPRGACARSPSLTIACAQVHAWTFLDSNRSWFAMERADEPVVTFLHAHQQGIAFEFRLLLKQRGVACGLGVDGGAGQR